MIGSAGSTLNPSTHISRVAATVANTSRLPVSLLEIQYFRRSIRPSLVRHENFADLPPSSLLGVTERLQPMPPTASAAE